ncbi:MAG: hypothetical protein ACWA49_04825 [Ruegeria sp.]
MPLELLLVLVIGGISGITLLLHLTGKSRLRLLSAETARAEWLRHFPEDDILDITLAHDNHAALVRTDLGAGLLWAFGADTVARYLHDFDWIDQPDGIEIQFRDFATPGVTVRLEETERRHWRHLLEPA